MIKLDTAAKLTGMSQRTLWRRIKAGEFTKTNKYGGLRRVAIPVDSIVDYIPLPLAASDIELICFADQGDAQAQTDLALLFMEYKHYERAIIWLKLAAKQQYPEAMYWLARCYISGRGVLQDVTTGLSWLQKAAEKGHSIAKRLVLEY